MAQNVGKQIAGLQGMGPAELRQKYRELFGEPSRSGNREFLVKRLAWRMQSLAEGGLSERARQRAAELARDADIRTTMPRAPAVTAAPPAGVATINPGKRLPIPGTILTRRYHGQLIQVTVLPNGFEYEGRIYRSLSAVAKTVTGSHWNGRLFFGLTDGGNR
jgi:hypothetical protein